MLRTSLPSSVLPIPLQNFPSLDSKCVGLFKDGPPERIHAAVHSITSATPTSGGPNKLWHLPASFNKAESASVPSRHGSTPNNSPKRCAIHRTRRDRKSVV